MAVTIVTTVTYKKLFAVLYIDYFFTNNTYKRE